MAPELAVKISPTNWIRDFGYVESWSKGTSVAPDGWSMTGVAGSVARESTEVKVGTYAMKIISGGSSVYASEYDLEIQARMVQSIKTKSVKFSNYLPGKTIKFGMWVKCSSASKARIYINDGVARSNSSYHTGGGDWEFLEIEHQVDDNPTTLLLGAEVASSAVTAYFDGGVLVEGDTIFTDLRGTNVYARNRDWKPTVKLSLGNFNISRRHGSRIDDQKFQEKKLRIKVQIHNTTLSGARTIFDNIIKAAQGGQKDLLLENDRLVQGVLSGIPQLQQDIEGQVYFFDLQFICPEVFLEYIARFRNEEVVSASPHTFNFEVAGSVENFPRYHFLAPAGHTISSISLENLTTGELLSYVDNVLPGTTLIVDTDTQEITNDGIDGASYFQGDWVMLKPETNYMKFTGTVGITLWIDWTEKYV